jgi:methylphosphotriester-DNA--protein-cysteine methyltransferase
MQMLESGSSQKVEGIARDVGYLSKKNFYHAFRRVAGMTPKEFQQLPMLCRHKLAADIVNRTGIVGGPIR